MGMPKTLVEAVRVARQGLILGVLNRCSLLAFQYRTSEKPLWQEAHFRAPDREGMIDDPLQESGCRRDATVMRR